MSLSTLDRIRIQRQREALLRCTCDEARAALLADFQRAAKRSAEAARKRSLKLKGDHHEVSATRHDRCPDRNQL